LLQRQGMPRNLRTTYEFVRKRSKINLRKS